jgi:hypothetical protein
LRRLFFFHRLVSTPWELSVQIMLRSFSFYLTLHSPLYSKEFVICSCFLLMFFRTEADAELRLESHHFGIKLSLARSFQVNSTFTINLHIGGEKLASCSY